VLGDEGGQAALDVEAAGVDLLDALEDRDGLGREPLPGQLVRHLAQGSDRFTASPGRDEGVRELQPQPAVLRPCLELGLGQLHRLAELLTGQQLGQAGALPLRQPVENHAPATSEICLGQVRPGF